MLVRHFHNMEDDSAGIFYNEEGGGVDWLSDGLFVNNNHVQFSFMCMFCTSLFVLLYFFFWPLCCLFFFDILILISPFGIFKLFLQMKSEYRVSSQGAHLKKWRRAEGGAKIVGVFRVKNHDFTPKNHIFSNFRGGALRVRPPLDPPLEYTNIYL